MPNKRITGFQFFPGDSDKVMVTSADSQIRIISGVDTICKLKKGPNQVSSRYVNAAVNLFVIDLVDILQLQVFEQH